MAERARAVRSDLFQGLRAERFDIILCNPPYVNRQDIDDMPREYRAEPLHALAAGEDGLDLALQILAAAPAWLVERGVLFLELGNSWAALDALCGDLALTWLDFADGGHGVLAATREELGAAQGLFTGLAAARGAGSP